MTYYTPAKGLWIKIVKEELRKRPRKRKSVSGGGDCQKAQPSGGKNICETF